MAENTVLGGQIFTYGTRIFQEFTLHSGATFLDPTGMVVTLTKPDKTTVVLVYGTAPELTVLSPGTYRITTIPLQAGTWQVRVETTNPVKAIQWSFRVTASNVGT